MVDYRPIKGGPVGCEWNDVLDIRISRYQNPPGSGAWIERCASVRKRAGVSYVLVDPTTGEICELVNSPPVTKEGQYNLF
jgi:hypothetical protein